MNSTASAQAAPIPSMSASTSAPAPPFHLAPRRSTPLPDWNYRHSVGLELARQLPRYRGAHVQPPRAGVRSLVGARRVSVAWRARRPGGGRGGDRRLPLRARGWSAELSVPLPSRDRGVAARGGGLAAGQNSGRRTRA